MALYFNNEVKYHCKVSSYISNNNVCSVTPNQYLDISSSGMSKSSLKKAILCGVGELFEREIMLASKLNAKKYPNNEVVGYSLVDKKEVSISLDYIINDKKLLADSCGLASHRNSNECIINAFNEFIERQSFLLNYLSKSGGQLINISSTSNFNYIKRAYPSLKLYNISLIDNYYVILGKAMENGNFYVGLGSSPNIGVAIEQCVREMNQSHMVYSDNKNNSYKKKLNTLTCLDYGDVFFSLDSNRVCNAYNYLDEKSDSIDLAKLSNHNFNLEETCMILNRRFSMKPIVIFLESLRYDKNIKIIKIIDLNWFKTMAVSLYDKNDLDFIEEKTGKKLDRECTFIPFP